MKLLLLTMLGQLLQQNIRVNRDFMAGGPCQVLTMALAICRVNAQTVVERLYGSSLGMEKLTFQFRIQQNTF